MRCTLLVRVAGKGLSETEWNVESWWKEEVWRGKAPIEDGADDEGELWRGRSMEKCSMRC